MARMLELACYFCCSPISSAQSETKDTPTQTSLRAGCYAALLLAQGLTEEADILMTSAEIVLNFKFSAVGQSTKSEFPHNKEAQGVQFRE